MARETPQGMVDFLESAGLHITQCRDYRHIRYFIERDEPTAVLIYQVGSDLGFVLDEINAQLPCCVVLEEGTALDRVNVLRQGCRSVHIQPFSFSRLLYDLATIEGERSTRGWQHVGKFSLDAAAQAVMYAGKPLSLTRKQVLLLRFFLSRTNQVVSRVQIWEYVWGLDEYPKSNSVDALVCRLRAALPPDAAYCIEQIYGVGYRFRLVFQAPAPLQAPEFTIPLQAGLQFVADAEDGVKALERKEAAAAGSQGIAEEASPARRFNPPLVNQALPLQVD